MKNAFRFLLGCCVLAASTLFISSCAQQDNDETAALVEENTPAEEVYNPGDEITTRTDCDGTNVHWEYTGAEGTDHWDDLCDAWACGGNRQSPINIVPPATRTFARSLNFYYDDSELEIVNNGHTIQFNYDGGSHLKVNGTKYNLLQFHFHAGSEHTVKGVQYPAEIHFVHQNTTTGKLSVIGVFVEEGDENDFLADVLEHFPHHEGEYTSTDHYNATSLLPDSWNKWGKHFWYYDGSLTTPPCSEIVNWFVMEDKIEASHEQLEELAEILHGNYRPVQPLNTRLVRAQ
ncbi:MAG: carbonic anhydrase family protein [Bacteroidota bacterium]